MVSINQQHKLFLVLLLLIINLIFYPQISDANNYNSKELKEWLAEIPNLDVSKVKAGQTGYGLTVFQGYKIKQFPVTVIGVLKNFFNGSDAILVRLSGADINKNNLIRGMSGSPVYIEGKLIGAVSFGFDFSTEPVVGVTPIKDMLDAIIEPKNISLNIPISKTNDNNNDYDNKKISQNYDKAKTVSLLSPIATVGYSVRAQEYLSNVFKHYGIDLASGIGGAMDPKLGQSQEKLVSLASSETTTENKLPLPGSSISVLLTTGDFSSAATGTVTAALKGQVVAFGHPFLQAGTVDFPMATSFIHTVVSNLVASVKIASPVDVIGAILADRPWSVGGSLNHQPKMVKTHIKVVDEARNLVKNFNVNIVNHPHLTPSLLAASVMSAIDSTHQSNKAYVATINSDFNIAKYGKFSKSGSFASNVPEHAALTSGSKLTVLSDPIGSFVEKIASKIYVNDFELTTLDSVDLTITICDARKTAQIEEVYLDKNEIAPGAELNVKCVIKPFLGEKFIQKLSFKIPQNIPDGDLLIGISNGIGIKALESKFEIKEPPAQNMNDLLKKLFINHEYNYLSGVIALPRPVVEINDFLFENPPPTWFSMYFSNTDSKGVFVSKSKLQAKVEEPYILQGNHILSVKVVNPNKYLAQNLNLFPDIVKSQEPPQSTYSTSEVNKILGSSTLNSSIKILASLTNTDESKNNADKDKAKEAKKTENTIQAAIAEVNSSIYPHNRLLKQYIQGTYATFNEGTFNNTTVDSLGRLRVIPTTTQINLPSLAPYSKPTAIAEYNNFLFIASGNELYQLNLQTNQNQLITKFKEGLITSLCINRQGNLYVALCPVGKIVCFNQLFSANQPNKFQYKEITQLKESIINCLTYTPDDNLYIGVSNPGILYKLNLKAKTDALKSIETDSNHVTTINYFDFDKSIYVGTSQSGILYKLDNDFKLKTIYQSQNSTITGIAKDKEDNIYLSTYDKGQLIKIDKDGQLAPIGDSQAFYTLFNTDARIIAGDAEGDITMISNDELLNRPYFIPIKHTHTDAVIAACKNNSGDAFMLCRNGAMIEKISSKNSSVNDYISPVFDAGDNSKWLRINLLNKLLLNDTNFNQSFKLETRTGNSSTPNNTWSPFSQTISNNTNDYFTINSQDNRYFQYKLTFNEPANIVGRVIIDLLNSNHMPYFTSVSLTVNQMLSKKVPITAIGHDIDNDNLILALRSSSDGGKTYKIISQVIKNDSEKADSNVQKSSKTKNVKANKKDKGAKQTETASDNKDNDKPSDTKTNNQNDSKDKDTKSADTNSDSKDSSKDKDTKSTDTKADSKDSSKDKDTKSADTNSDSKDSSKDKDTKSTDNNSDSKKNIDNKNFITSSVKSANTFKFELDTTKLDDGKHLFRFDLSDKLSNFYNHKCAHYYIPVVIDNTKPKLIKAQIEMLANHHLNFFLKASDNIAIYAAVFQFDSSYEYALTAQDDYTNPQVKEFVVNDIKIPQKAQSIIFKIYDAAGNEVVKTIKLR